MTYSSPMSQGVPPRGLRRVSAFFLLLLIVPLFIPALPGAPSGDRTPVKLLLAFATVRERRAPPYPMIYFYEHDGISDGKLAGKVEPKGGGTNTTRADMHPVLTRDGWLCAFSGQFGVSDGAKIELWDRKEKKLLPVPVLNDEGKLHRMHPSLSGDGKLIAFTVYGWPGVGPRWDVLVHDTAAKKLLELPRLNLEKSDERMPALSGDGRYLAYTSNAPGGQGGMDIYLYDLKEKKPVALPELNSPEMDSEPSLSGDGRLIAFASDRPSGGGRDIFLFDRVTSQFLPLPNLNTGNHEHSPSLSPDGRFIAFVSERISGAGERDIYLYDRQTEKLLATPGLNSKEDDFDPCLMVIETQN